MMTKLSNRDREAIAAYLDDELNSKERARLELRLKADQNLQAALEEMQQTRTLIRSLPPVRAPHNFTLTPEMAGIRKPFFERMLPAFSWASAVATVLLLAVFLGDLSGFLRPQPVLTALRAGEPEITAQAEAELPVEGVGEAAPAEGEVLPAPTSEVMGTPGPQRLEAEEFAQGEPLDEEDMEMSADKSGAPTPSPAPTESPLPAPTFTLEPPPAPETTSTRTGVDISGLRVLEIVLALFALTTGITALLLRRQLQR
jgi:hypothetical protein